MRLGSSLQTRTFIAGVAGKAVTGNTVLITNGGQLGVLLSSARYKQDIQPIDNQQDKLQQLRPVTFRYKDEPTGPLQYGLIAEEVAQVYPELVTRDADGTLEGVRYEELTPLLLHELQQQRHALERAQQRGDDQARQLDAQAQQLVAQAQQLQVVSQQFAELKAQNEALLATMERLQAREEKTVATGEWSCPCGRPRL